MTSPFMPLKFSTSAFLIFLLTAGAAFSQEAWKDNYAFSAITSVLNESPEGKILANNADVTELSFLQQDRTWLPSIQLDLSADSQLVQGDYHYIRNQGVTPGPQIIAEPSASIGIYQRLPGNGQISVGAGYGFSYLAGHDSYIQKPYVQLGFSQGLSGGAFFLTKDPAKELLEKQKEIFALEVLEAKFELAVRFISAVQDYNLSLLEHECCLAVLRKTESEWREQEKRHQEGQRNDIELFNSHMNKTQALQNYQQATQKLMESEAVLSTYGIEGISECSGVFRAGILELLGGSYGENSETTMREHEILNEIEREGLSMKIEESKSSPSFYMRTTLSPDQGRNGEYSDLSRSLRDIADLSHAWSLSATVGISMNLDFSSQGSIQKKASEKKIQNLNLELEVLRDEQAVLRNIYREWNVAYPSYCAEMEIALEEEEQFIRDIRSLWEKNQITEAEYLAAEVGYCETRLNHYRSVWNMILGKLSILRLSSDWEEFIRQFTEVLK